MHLHKIHLSYVKDKQDTLLLNYPCTSLTGIYLIHITFSKYSRRPSGEEKNVNFGKQEPDSVTVIHID